MSARDPAMTKAEAIRLLGGNAATAARAIGISPQAIQQWPERLTPRLADRVIAARWRLDQCLAREDRLAEKRTWAYAQEATRTPKRSPSKA